MAFSIPTYESHVKPNYRHGSFDPARNQNANWISHVSPTTFTDTGGNGPHRRLRTVDSSIWWLAYELKVDPTWTSAGQGNFGGVTPDLHTTPGDVIPLSGGFLVSPIGMSYIGGNLIVTAQPMWPNHTFLVAAGLAKGVWHSLLLEYRLGRTDGSTPIPGRIRCWLNGADTPIVDTGDIHTLWRDTEGDVQTLLDVLEGGIYSENVSQDCILSQTAGRWGRTVSECLADSQMTFGNSIISNVYRGTGTNLGPSFITMLSSRLDTNFLVPPQFGGVPAPPLGTEVQTGPYGTPIQWNSATPVDPPPNNPPTVIEQMIGPWGNPIQWDSTAAPVGTGGAGLGGRFFKRFHGPARLTDVAADLYTVPTGKRATIRHIHVSNPTPQSVDFTFSIGTDTAATRLWDGYPIAAYDLLQHFRDHALSEGEKIQVYASANNALNLTIDGYEESLEPRASTDIYSEGAYGDETYGT